MTTSRANSYIGFIGVFDSGVGGLSVLRAIRQQLPHEDLLYIADSAYAPYGDLAAGQIRARSELIADYLVSHGVNAVVVACNTATAHAVEHLRGLFSLPIIAIEPALKPAVQCSINGAVGLLATSATLASSRYADLLARYGKCARVIAQACPGLVEQIERGDWQSEAVRELLRGYLAPLLAAGVDQIVLGCTHYPFVQPLIAELVGPEIEILETGAAVAVELQRRLAALGQLKTAGQGELRFMTSGTPEKVGPIINKLWQDDVMLQQLDM